MSRLGVPQKAWLGRIPGDACPDLNLKIPDKLGWGRKSPVPNSETLDVPQKQKERQVPADASQGLCLDAVFLLVLRRTSKKQTAQRVEVHMTERSYHLCLQSAFLKCIRTVWSLHSGRIVLAQVRMQIYYRVAGVLLWGQPLTIRGRLAH